MLNLLWLLLPVAAAGGWLAARRSAGARPEAFWDYASNFHEGLHVLMNERHGKPDDLFERVSDTDRDTADTHLALGNLFRRRGEVNRAILLHQSLLEKPELGDSVHGDALFELARDYDSAGLLDRSEQAFNQLIERGQRVNDAYDSLLQLHERERDWVTAISVASRYSDASGTPCEKQVAHYYCELAQEARSAGYIEQSRELLDKALQQSDDSARANMMLADMALEADQFEEALARFRHIEQQRPELMPEIIESWFKALRGLGDDDQLREFLEQIRARRNAYSVIRTTRGVIEQLDGADAANRFFKEQILRRPSLKGLRDWAHDQIALSKPEEREKVTVICTMLDQVVEDKPAYQCASCGFRGNQMHWRCPGCGNWDSVRTIIGVEGE